MSTHNIERNLVRRAIVRGETRKARRQASERDTLTTISRIAKAGVPILKEMGAEEATVLGLMMDIEHVHGIGQLDLDRFLEAAETSRGDFVHDIVGIYRNFNRDTLQLENCFEPRFTNYSKA